MRTTGGQEEGKGRTRGGQRENTERTRAGEGEDKGRKTGEDKGERPEGKGGPQKFLLSHICSFKCATKSEVCLNIPNKIEIL